MEIIEHELGTVGGVVHNFPAVVLGPVGSMGTSDFHLIGSVVKHVARKWFATDANDIQAVTSLVQTLYTETTFGDMVGQTLRERWLCGSMMRAICYPCATHTSKLESSSASVFVA
jgi:hypothetical protein